MTEGKFFIFFFAKKRKKTIFPEKPGKPEKALLQPFSEEVLFPETLAYTDFQTDDDGCGNYLYDRQKIQL